MALNAQNQNIVSEIMQLGATTLVTDDAVASMRTRWDEQDVFNELDTQNVEDEFPHLTQSIVGNAVGALTAIRDLLDANGGQHRIALELLKG